MSPPSKFSFMPVLMLFALAGSAPWARAGDPCLYERTITAGDPGTYDYFGYSVAIDGDVAVIGTGYDDTLATDAGSAYVFRWNGDSWTEEQKLVPADLDEQDFMGWSVAVDGDRIAVSAPGNDQVEEWAGAVYIFEYDGAVWVQTTKLTPSAEQQNEWYGNVVVLNDDVLAVGTPFHTAPNAPFRSGGVYVYRFTGTTWAEEQIVVPSDPYYEGRFGSYVALDGARLLVGEDFESTSPSIVSGHLFSYDGEAWVETASLETTDEIVSHEGAIVALDGDRALVSPGDWFGSLGEIHVFEFNGTAWTKTAILYPPAGTAANGFGMSVAAADGLILVGHPLADNIITDAGAVYVYHQVDGNWRLEDTLLPSLLTAYGKFGTSLAAQDNRAITGAPYANEAGLDAGTVYIFEDITDGDCNGNNSLDACDIATETSEDCNADGQPDECFVIDCNENAIQDECDIVTGTSLDCQPDGVPDECQGIDCNANGVMDECDVFSGYSADANDNEIPDECEAVCESGCDLVEKLGLLPPAADDFFGASVALSGNLAAVGATGDDRIGGGSGSVSIYRCDGMEWTSEALIFGEENYSSFGNRLALDGNLLAASVGPTYNANDRVYLYRRLETGWSHWQTLTPSGDIEGHSFGGAIALDDDLLVVASAWDASIYCPECRDEVYVFRRVGDSWNEEQLLVSDGKVYFESFGSAVAVQDGTIFVGDGSDDEFGYTFGAVFIYQHDGTQWTLTRKLANENLYCPEFGKSLDFSAERLIVGARGAAYIFKHNSEEWLWEGETFSTQTLPTDEFGYSVAIDHDWAIVGAYGDDTITTNGGRVYSLQWNGSEWVEDHSFAPSDVANTDYFGKSIDISGLTVLAGADRDDDGGSSSGSVFFVSRVDTDCNGNGAADACDLDEGVSQDCNANAVPDECETDCNENNVPDDCDISGGTSQDCDASGVPDECEDDCNGNQSEDACDIAGGVSLDCQANGVPDECELDCNANAVPDDCDVTQETSRDSDANGIPDECDACDDLTRIEGPDTDSEDDFASSVAMFESTLVIGAYSDDRHDLNAGAAFVYTWDGSLWSFTQELPQPEPEGSHYYGLAVAVHGDLAAVLSQYDGEDNDPGSITIFRRTGASWELETTLLPFIGDSYEGNSSLDAGDGILVAGNLNIGTYAGAATAFEHDGTSWIKYELDPGDIEDYDHYGSDVAVDGDWIIVGAEWTPDVIPYGGAAAMFNKIDNSWSFVQRIFPSDPQEWQYFGSSVDVRGTWAVVGAPLDGDTADGAAYLFAFDGVDWVERQKLIPSDGAGSYEFGQSVAFGDDFLIVGSTTYDETLNAHGVAYVFRLNGEQWVETDRIVPSDNTSPYGFSESIDASGASAVIGMPFDSYPAAYVWGPLAGFDCDGNAHHDYCDIWSGLADDCNVNDRPDGCDIADGTSGDTNGNSIPDECESPSCPGDANGDGIVDPLDSGYVLARFNCAVGTGDPTCDAADVNVDGIVDPLDAGFVLSRFGACP